MPVDQSPARLVREGDAHVLATALNSARSRTIDLLRAYVDRLGPGLAVPYSPRLNPPLWEVGHVAWFWHYWIARNRQRHLGLRCDPDHGRPEGRLGSADALYNSSRVPHESRWRLPLPDLQATVGYLAASLEESLDLLARTDATPDGLYFFRLALLHEDMHAEAATYSAQTLDIPLPPHLEPRAEPLPALTAIRVPATTWRLGYHGDGFAFDNELVAHDIALAPFDIDSTAVSWRRFLPAVEAGAVAVPRPLRRLHGTWQIRRYGRTETLDLDTAAVHVGGHDAAAWCRWAGRRLPTEAEWECAASTRDDFAWGDAWEWTASRFAPYPGFVAHPYRDYSRFGFEATSCVLKGASRATDARIAHVKYRNFFPPERDDLHAGFRSCAP
jgi:gamma-glutamyl hercynylcysteine S-oxide synthase